DLIDRIAADPMFGLTKEEIMAELDPSKYIGRAPEQVDDFIADAVMPRISKYDNEEDMKVEINL
ncbi:MAG: adenylosuccinate lyase, partial [Butyricicoccaceae bacterium]